MVKSFKKYLLLLIPLLLSTNISAIEKTEDIVSLIKPATVQIVVSAKGFIDIPNFVFDYENNTFSTTTKINGFSSSTIDKTKQGTGFILSSDGIIATDPKILIDFENDIYKSIAEKYLQSIYKNIQDIGYVKAYEDIFNYLKENSINNFDTQVKVLRSDSASYDAEILHYDSVGLIKIQAVDLPTIYLSDSNVSLGEKIYSISYPLLENTVSESVFTEGVVNSIKNNQYQTSIISIEGSDGSPVIDTEGKLTGILISPGSVIPTSLLQNLIVSKNITLKPSLYREYYLLGLSYMENNYCKKAIDQFTKALEVNKDFPVEEYVKPKIDKCNTAIAAGESRDSLWDKIIFLFKYNTSNIYLWSCLILLFFLFIITYKYFINRFKNDEEKIKVIFKENDLDDIEINKSLEENGIEIDRKVREIKPFENIVELRPVMPDLTEVKYTPLKKVEITPRPESPHAPVTPPKAIQPDGPVVVITPFKTLNKPISSLSSDSTETKKDIRTDLPVKKRNEDII